ncbi:MAG: hypothetical protein ACI9Y8_001123 [Candidatus Omnitrophota bacterium]|jgi:hypothetical protein
MIPQLKVVNSSFFGREDALRSISKRVESFEQGYRQNIAILGYPLIGKTSLIQQYLDLNPSEIIQPIYIDLKPQTIDSFIEQFIRILLFRHLSQEHYAGPNEGVAILIERARNILPSTCKTAEGVLKLLEKKNHEAAFKLVFDITTQYHLESGKKCLVILDEFQQFEYFSIKQIYKIFGKQIMVQKNTMYIVLSSQPDVCKQILTTKLSLLFGNFECIELNSLQCNTVHRFVERKMGPTALPLSLMKYLISLTDGHPFYISAICDALKVIIERETAPTVTTTIVMEALQDTFYEHNGVLNQHFIHQIHQWNGSGARGNYLTLLMRIATGHTKLKLLSKDIRKTLAETTAQLNKLIAADVLVLDGGFYCFTNPVLKWWFKTVYLNRELSLLVDTDSKRAHFFSVIEKELHAEQIFHSNTVEQCVADLFGSFSNEIIEIDAKGKRMPAFDSIEVRDLPSGSKCIVATNQKSQWICQISQEPITEESVMRFATEKIVENQKKAQKIIIAMDDIQGNAVLLAKNKRIWPMGLSKVNRLFGLYGHPKLIHLSK